MRPRNASTGSSLFNLALAEKLFSALKAAGSVFANSVTSSSLELGARQNNDSPKRPSLHRPSGGSEISQMVTFSQVVLVESSSYNESS
jgi:hypothetical protein